MTVLASLTAFAGLKYVKSGLGGFFVCFCSLLLFLLVCFVLFCARCSHVLSVFSTRVEDILFFNMLVV